jgi:hypothetical protein
MYRIMVHETWVKTRGRFSFFSQGEVAEFMGRWALAALGISENAQPQDVAETVPVLRSRLVTLRGYDDVDLDQDLETLNQLTDVESTLFKVICPVFRHAARGLCVFVVRVGGTSERLVSVHRLLDAQGRPLPQTPWEGE